MELFKCSDCIALINPDDPEQTVYKCKYEKEALDFDPRTKTPCKRFMPREYIKALNYDSVMR